MAIRPRQAEMDALGVDPKMLSPMKEEVSVEEVVTPTGELKEKFDDAMGVLAPEGNYSDGALLTIAAAINEALQLFGPDATPVSPEGEEGMLPVSIVKAVEMLNKAQQDAGLTDYIIDVQTLTDDRALQQAAGKIMALAKNQTFKSFLSQLDPALSREGELPEMPSPAMVAQNSAPSEEINTEELFMRRM